MVASTLVEEPAMVALRLAEGSRLVVPGLASTMLDRVAFRRRRSE